MLLYTEEEMMKYQHVWNGSRMQPERWDFRQNQLLVKQQKAKDYEFKLQQEELKKKSGGKVLTQTQFSFGNGIHVGDFWEWKDLVELYNKYIGDGDLGASTLYKRQRVLSVLLRNREWNKLQSEVLAKNIEYQSRDGVGVLPNNSFVLDDNSAVVHKKWTGKEWKARGLEVGIDYSGEKTIRKHHKSEILERIRELNQLTLLDAKQEELI